MATDYFNNFSFKEMYARNIQDSKVTEDLWSAVITLVKRTGRVVRQDINGLCMLYTVAIIPKKPWWRRALLVMTRICRANFVFLLPMFLVQETDNCITEPGGEASPTLSLNPLTFYTLLYYFFKKTSRGKLHSYYIFTVEYCTPSPNVSTV